MSTAIALFTRDLRVHDNPVLQAAASSADRVLPVFVLDDAILHSGFVSANRAAFLAQALADLRGRLERLGAGLVVRRGRVAAEVARLAQQHDVGRVHVAADVSGYARRREDDLRCALADQRRELRVHDASTTVVAPGALTPSGGRDHFVVFTPYFRRWAEADKRSVLDPPRRLSVPDVDRGRLPTADEISDGDTSPELPEGGEGPGRRLLDSWADGPVQDYADRHDDLAAGGTSRLSPYLHFGCLSPTELVARSNGGSAGAQAFVRQVAWRDFHHQVLAARPETARADYRHRQDSWRRSQRDLTAWRHGRTGFPIVDAAMHQLRREGWMHNRARLVVGSFLTKTLYVDWRAGARHFVDLLVDADVANNQLNWQWVAGTGTDTRPNRVLNPLLQAHRYDPDGDYVRRYLPELAEVGGRSVHEPWRLPADQRRRLDYPEPIVDLADARDRFLAARGR